MRQELSQAVLVGDAQRAQRILLHPLVDATEREIRRNEAEREAPAAALSAAQRLLRRSEQTEASCTGLRRAKERLLQQLRAEVQECEQELEARRAAHRERAEAEVSQWQQAGATDGLPPTATSTVASRWRPINSSHGEGTGEGARGRTRQRMVRWQASATFAAAHRSVSSGRRTRSTGSTTTRPCL